MPARIATQSVAGGENPTNLLLLYLVWQKQKSQQSLAVSGGSERIRTSDTLTGMLVFKTSPFNHSGTLPSFFQYVVSLLLSIDRIRMLFFISVR